MPSSSSSTGSQSQAQPSCAPPPLPHRAAQTLKTYKTGRFVQSAAVSPILDHILLGGGQDASQVRRCFVGRLLRRCIVYPNPNRPTLP
jgi:hypothetical protein